MGLHEGSAGRRTAARVRRPRPRRALAFANREERDGEGRSRRGVPEGRSSRCVRLRGGGGAVRRVDERGRPRGGRRLAVDARLRHDGRQLQAEVPRQGAAGDVPAVGRAMDGRALRGPRRHDMPRHRPVLHAEGRRARTPETGVRRPRHRPLGPRRPATGKLPREGRADRFRPDAPSRRRRPHLQSLLAVQRHHPPHRGHAARVRAARAASRRPPRVRARRDERRVRRVGVLPRPRQLDGRHVRDRRARSVRRKGLQAHGMEGPSETGGRQVDGVLRATP